MSEKITIFAPEITTAKINVMKYMGSKARFAKDFLPIILKQRKKGQTFVDLFCGGCSVVQLVDGPRIANDINTHLIEMWKGLIADPEYYPKYIPRDFYSDVRDSYNKKDGRFTDALIGYVGFMGSYNGRFFDGGYSGHAVEIKNGKTRDYIGENIKNTMAQIKDLKDVKFLNYDYRKCPIPPHSLIYCDIPYKGTKQYSTSRNFDYDEFYMWCVKMKEAGHTIFVSEYAMPPAFKCVWEKTAKTTINQTITKNAVERLFTL